VGRYALILVVANVLLFDFYLFQASRFMAGPASVLVVLAAVALRTRRKTTQQVL
jgi:hypothetical protein